MTSEILAKIAAALLSLYPAITGYLSPDSLSAQVQLVGGFTINILFLAMVLMAGTVILEVVYKTWLRQTSIGCWLCEHIGYCHLGIAFLATVIPFSASRDNDISVGAMFIYLLILGMNLCMAYIQAKKNENTEGQAHV